MEIPPPPVPKSRLSAWRQTDQTVDSPFSTRFMSVSTHTIVYEETAQRRQIREATGLDWPWRFFFASRIRLDPATRPSSVLTALIRRKVTAAFVDRLSTRGFVDITKAGQTAVSMGDAKGITKRYHARFELSVDDLSVELSPTDTTSFSGLEDSELLTFPVEGYLAIWVGDDDYYIAGGAYPSGSPESGPPTLTAALCEVIDPTAAREELLGLIAGCGDQ